MAGKVFLDQTIKDNETKMKRSDSMVTLLYKEESLNIGHTVEENKVGYERGVS